MVKEQEYSDDELSFIREQLEGRENITVSQDDNHLDIKVTPKKTKQEIRYEKKRNKVPPYKNPAHWAAGFIVAPILLSGILMFLLFRVEAMFGSGSLRWLANDESGQSVTNIATDMGFTWLSPVVNIYENRWLIIAALFTFFFIIASLLILYDNFISGKNLTNRSKKRKENKKNKASQGTDKTDHIVDDVKKEDANNVKVT